MATTAAIGAAVAASGGVSAAAASRTAGGLRPCVGLDAAVGCERQPVLPRRLTKPQTNPYPYPYPYPYP